MHLDIWCLLPSYCWLPRLYKFYNKIYKIYAYITLKVKPFYEWKFLQNTFHIIPFNFFLIILGSFAIKIGFILEEKMAFIKACYLISLFSKNYLQHELWYLVTNFTINDAIPSYLNLKLEFILQLSSLIYQSHKSRYSYPLIEVQPCRY